MTRRRPSNPLPTPCQPTFQPPFQPRANPAPTPANTHPLYPLRLESPSGRASPPVKEGESTDIAQRVDRLRPDHRDPRAVEIRRCSGRPCRAGACRPNFIESGSRPKVGMAEVSE
jgi:hypothetical protein